MWIGGGDLERDSRTQVWNLESFHSNCVVLENHPVLLCHKFPICKTCSGQYAAKTKRGSMLEQVAEIWSTGSPFR